MGCSYFYFIFIGFILALCDIRKGSGTCPHVQLHMLVQTKPGNSYNSILSLKRPKYLILLLCKSALCDVTKGTSSVAGPSVGIRWLCPSSQQSHWNKDAFFFSVREREREILLLRLTLRHLHQGEPFTTVFCALCRSQHRFVIQCFLLLVRLFNDGSSSLATDGLLCSHMLLLLLLSLPWWL